MKLAVVLIVLVAIGWLWRYLAPPGEAPSWQTLLIVIASVFFVFWALTSGRYS